MDGVHIATSDEGDDMVGIEVEFDGIGDGIGDTDARVSVATSTRRPFFLLPLLLLLLRMIDVEEDTIPVFAESYASYASYASASNAATSNKIDGIVARGPVSTLSPRDFCLLLRLEGGGRGGRSVVLDFLRVLGLVIFPPFVSSSIYALFFVSRFFFLTVMRTLFFSHATVHTRFFHEQQTTNAAATTVLETQETRYATRTQHPTNPQTRYFRH